MTYRAKSSLRANSAARFGDRVAAFLSRLAGFPPASLRRTGQTRSEPACKSAAERGHTLPGIRRSRNLFASKRSTTSQAARPSVVNAPRVIICISTNGRSAQL